MIKKFITIKDMAVFHNFMWDTSVLDKQGCVQQFSQVNVIYGRNYSGKTTLSRMVRAFETGRLSDKYGSCSFTIETETDILSEQNYKDKPILVRVFNDDFVRENLGFVIDQSGTIAPFAVLGEDNERIEGKIRSIVDELGSDIDGKRTGLYAEKEAAQKKFLDIKGNFDTTVSSLDKQKNIKATDRKIGIKYNSERFGNQNYNIRNLDSDIATVLSDTYSPLDSVQIKQYETYLTEKEIGIPTEIEPFEPIIRDIALSVAELCKRSINNSNKIQELVNDIALQEWVKQGINYNNGRDYCAFCGQPLTDVRWQELFSHFDEESEKLNKELLAVKETIKSEKLRVENGFSPNCEDFYSDYKEEINSLIDRYQEESRKYVSKLNALSEQVECRISSIYKPVEYDVSIPEYSFSQIFGDYSNIRMQSIAHATGITSRKAEAQKQLRLAEVYNFVISIGYLQIASQIDKLKLEKIEAQEDLSKAKEIIERKQSEILSLRRQQNDEEKGAVKVNEYLHTFFGHRYLSLVAKIEGQDDQKQIYFEIERNGKKAFHLSEGEKSLIAFCYFVAKLNDVETMGKHPIIWIDDPISSLDSNHIYFVYSLIAQEILAKDCYEQLFITTHNLQFLKYLRVLSINNHSKGKGVHRSNFLIDRIGDTSVLKVMPHYLKLHGTEFNHWFDCIFQCANQNEITDENIYLFESFGNNARKFLETYLYYRYPDKKDFNTHLKRFFGDSDIPQIIVRKVSDEQSHADGDLENHDLPFEEPETIIAAKKILERLEAIDKEQYEALIESIQ